jgi:hypothetical protein
VYFETYAEPFPIVEPYQVVTARRYVVRPVVVTPPPIVRERTIVVRRPALVGPPMPPPYWSPTGKPTNAEGAQGPDGALVFE